MAKHLFFFLIVFFTLFGCSMVNESNILGTWLVTHVYSESSSGDYYYQFKSDGTCSRDTDKAKLFTSEAQNNGSYTIDSYNSRISISFFTNKYQVYISEPIMYWYLNGVETTRLQKQ